MAKLPTVTSNIPRDLRTFVDRVREALDSKSPDAAVTTRQLVAAGIASYTGNILGPATAAEVQVTPSRPNNVTASGALANIMVTWDKPVYANHAFAEIWAAARTQEQEDAEPPEDPTIGQAELVGMSPGTFFAHNIGAGGDRWYWVRFVNFAGTVGPYQSTEGVAGSTGQSPELLLELLSGEITSSQLATSLSSRIDLIDGASTVAGSVNARIASVQNQVNELLNLPEWNSTTTYAVDDQVVHNGFLYVALQANTNVEPGTANPPQWESIGEYATIGDAVAAHTTQLTELEDGLGTEISDRQLLATRLIGDYDPGEAAPDLAELTQGLIYQEREARSDAVGSVVSSVDSLVALTNLQNRSFFQATEPVSDDDYTLRIGDMWVDTDQELADDYLDGDYVIRSNRIYRYDGSGWVEAMDYGFADFFSALRTEKTARVDEDEALSTSIANLDALLTTKEGLLYSAIEQEATARANADSANATLINTLSSTVTTNNTTLTSAVQTEATTRAEETGDLFAQYTVKVDTNGYVSGFGLASTATNGTPFSEFIVRADSFAIGEPTTGTPSESPSYPFIVRATQTTINGETVPAGVYMKDAFIQNGTITNAKIGNAAIDDAKIFNVDAGKITTGYLDAQRIEAGSITADLINTDGLVIKDANGNVIFTSGSTLAVPTSANFTGGEEIFNGAHKFVDINGRPAGLKTAAYSTFSEPAEDGTYASVSYIDVEKGIIEFRPHAILDIPDQNTAYSKYLLYPAFKVNPNTEYEFTYRYKVSGASSLSTYGIGVWSTTDDLEDGNTCLRKLTSSTVYETGVQNTSTYDTQVGNSQTNHTTWTTKTFTWTPDAGTKWASVQFSALRSVVFEIDVVSVVSKATVGATFDVNISGQITSANASTYIADAAIGTAQITDGTITTAKIEDVIKSTNFDGTVADGSVTDDGTVGWAIAKDGHAVFQDATIRGVIKSSDDKMVIDTVNKYIRIEV